MQVNRGRAAADHRGGNLLRYDPRLAYPKQNDLAFAVRQNVYDLLNLLRLQTRSGFRNRLRFGPKQVDHLSVIRSFAHAATFDIRVARQYASSGRVFLITLSLWERARKIQRELSTFS